MKEKIVSFGYYLLYGVLGYLTFLKFFYLILSTIYILYAIIMKSFIVFSMYVLFPAALLGIYFGVMCYRKRNIYYKIFKPGIQKLVLTFVVVFIFFIIIPKCHVTTLLILGLFLNSYPLSSLILYTLKNYKKKNFSKNLEIIIILFLLLNPFIYPLI